MRKDISYYERWNASNVNTYANSTLDTWLNNTYIDELDAAVIPFIGTTRFRYSIGNDSWNMGTLGRSVFVLSVTELGKTHDYTNTEGSPLPIASTLQIAYNDVGTALPQCTRSPVLVNSTAVFSLTASGDLGSGDCIHETNVRPCFTLPSALRVDANLNILPGSVSA